MKPLLMLTAALLCGCASKWEKPGATETEFYRDEFECRQIATSMYPARPPQAVAPAYIGPSQTRCVPTGFGGVNCTTTPGQVIPGVQPIDVSGLQINAAVESCLRGRGYRKQ